MIEKTKHFFGDAVDLMDAETSYMVTIPIRVYQNMQLDMTDEQIFKRVSRMHQKDVYLPSYGIYVSSEM